jgi:hypothetical protein
MTINNLSPQLGLSDLEVKRGDKGVHTCNIAITTETNVPTCMWFGRSIGDKGINTWNVNVYKHDDNAKIEFIFKQTKA